MKYMLMMNSPRNCSYQIADWPMADIQAHIAFMIGFAKKLGATGELLAAEGLNGPEHATLVRAGAEGQPITDGVCGARLRYRGRSFSRARAGRRTAEHGH